MEAASAFGGAEGRVVVGVKSGSDAMVWALSELTVTRGEPRIRRL